MGGFRIWMLFPLVGALAVLIVMGERLLGSDPGQRDVLPSALIDRDVPVFALPGLSGGEGLSNTDLKGGGVKLLNIWASWCGPCRVEHPNIKALAKDVPVHGLNYKDTTANAQAFLDELGDPYTKIGADENGRIGIEFGVYGVPETFVINDEGKIIFKHVGPVLQRDMDRIRAVIEKAGG